MRRLLLGQTIVDRAGYQVISESELASAVLDIVQWLVDKKISPRSCHWRVILCDIDHIRMKPVSFDSEHISFYQKQLESMVSADLVPVLLAPPDLCFISVASLTCLQAHLVTLGSINQWYLDSMRGEAFQWPLVCCKQSLSRKTAVCLMAISILGALGGLFFLNYNIDPQDAVVGGQQDSDQVPDVHQAVAQVQSERETIMPVVNFLSMLSHDTEQDIKLTRIIGMVDHVEIIGIAPSMSAVLRMLVHLSGQPVLRKPQLISSRPIAVDGHAVSTQRDNLPFQHIQFEIRAMVDMSLSRVGEQVERCHQADRAQHFMQMMALAKSQGIQWVGAENIGEVGQDRLVLTGAYGGLLRYIVHLAKQRTCFKIVQIELMPAAQGACRLVLGLDWSFVE